MEYQVVTTDDGATRLIIAGAKGEANNDVNGDLRLTIHATLGEIFSFGAGLLNDCYEIDREAGSPHYVLCEHCAAVRERKS